MAGENITVASLLAEEGGQGIKVENGQVGPCVIVARATGPVLTSDKEEKQVILPTTLNFAQRRS